MQKNKSALGPARVIAHRGDSAHAPENTLIAIEKAISKGANWVKFDVSLTKDEVPVLLHDATLARTTNLSGLVSHTTWAELQAADAGSWFGEAFKGEPLPSLDQALGYIRAADICVNIGLKPDEGREALLAAKVREALAAVAPELLPRNVLFVAFDEKILHEIRQMTAVERIGLLADPLPDNWLEKLKDLKADSLHIPSQFVTPELVKTATGNGFKIVAYTVNEAAQAQALFDMGVAAVLSDDADLMKRNKLSA